MISGIDLSELTREQLIALVRWYDERYLDMGQEDLCSDFLDNDGFAYVGMPRSMGFALWFEKRQPDPVEAPIEVKETAT